MSKIPCDPAGGNLRFSKHRRVACVVLACGVVMENISAISRLYLVLPRYLLRHQFPSSSISNVKQGINRPWPAGSFCDYAHYSRLRLGLQPVQRNSDTSEKDCLVPCERAWKLLHIIDWLSWLPCCWVSQYILLGPFQLRVSRPP